MYLKYANEVVEELDTNKRVAFLLCRANCKPSAFGMVKDLSQLNRDLKNVILVDVSFYSNFLFSKVIHIRIQSIVFPCSLRTESILNLSLMTPLIENFIN